MATEDELIQVSFTVKDAQELFVHLTYDVVSRRTIGWLTLARKSSRAILYRFAAAEALAARSEKAV